MNNSLTQITIDHLHQYAYCPRRAHLMYVDGRWESNLYTDEGLSAHSRVDGETDVLPSAEEGDAEPKISRSVMLSSETLGLIGKPDVVETARGEAVPVDTKRGKPPATPEQCYEPERVQLMAQGLLLREHGFVSNEGWLYFAGARKRVRVVFTTDDRRRTRIVKTLLDYGDRIQYSVFCCQVNRRELHRLKELLKKRSIPKDDRILFVDAGKVDHQKPTPEISYIGQKWVPEERCQIL